jgi:glucosylceramidase
MSTPMAERRSVSPSPPDGPLVDVALDEPRQQLRGLGAALTESSAKLLAELPADRRHEVLEALFDPSNGGLSIVRVAIGASDFSIEHVSLADTPGPTDSPLSSFSIDRDRRWVIPVLRDILAIRPDIEIVASPWSAPGWMKDTGLYGYGSLPEANEEVFADYLVAFLAAYRDEGIDVDWLTVQNEPAAVQLSYPSMLMDADQQARLVTDHLGPALVEASLSTKVLVWDHNWCNAEAPGGCVGDGEAAFPLEVLARTGGAPPIAGTAFHCYGGDQAAANEVVHAASPELEIWLTECSGGGWQTDPFADLAMLVLNDRNHWSNATLLWNLALDAEGGPHLGGCDNCRGVVTIDPSTNDWTPEVELDLLTTLGRYTPPGSVALAVSSSSDEVLASAACDPDGRVSVTMFNRGAAATAWIRLGALDLPIDLAERSVTAVRAPSSITCRSAAS